MEQANTYFLDEYYISKPTFIGSKPDFKIMVAKIIDGVLGFYLSKVEYYYLAIYGINPKTGKWDELTSEELLVTKLGEGQKSICQKLFEEDKNRVDFELYLYDEDITKSKFSWSLGDFVDLKTTARDFEEFQNYLEKVGLPKKLFYKENERVVAPLQSRHVISQLFNIFGWRRSYSPAEWENYRLDG